ncbi:benzoate-CoA ligase family protein [bacterium]|nr:benzoate-CoA ligase family protein [bacterium]
MERAKRENPATSGGAAAEAHNAAAHFIDRHPREGRGGKIAIIDDAGAYSYDELAERVNRAGNALKDLEIGPGERVMLAMLDGIDWAAAFWGAIKIGAIPVPVNTMLATADYAYLLRDSAARALIASAALMPRIESALGGQARPPIVIVSGGARIAGAYKFDELTSTADARLVAAPRRPDDIAFWLYSSGSTGRPKAVMHRGRAMLPTAVLYAERVLGIGGGDVCFSASKMFFAYGLGNAMTFPLHAGATVVLMAERPTPDAVMRVLRTHNPTVFYGVPTLYAGILANPANSRASGSARLRICTSAGEALPAAVAERWRERFGIEILDGIGSTEALHIFITNRIGDVRRGSTGKPVAGYEIELRDETGGAISGAGTGDLWVRGESIGAGYWNKPEATALTFAGGWLRTGDKYRRDEDGYYHFAGRADDMLKVGGVWVSPFEVENALTAHPEVFEAAVIGGEDADRLIKPKAFVVLKDRSRASAAMADELKEFVKGRLAPYKYPRWIEFRDELPRTATGKLKRYELAREAEAAGEKRR